MSKNKSNLRWKEVLLAICAVVLMVGWIFAAGGCNTVSGFAQDVHAASEGTKAFLVKDD